MHFTVKISSSFFDQQGYSRNENFMKHQNIRDSPFYAKQLSPSPIPRPALSVPSPFPNFSPPPPRLQGYQRHQTQVRQNFLKPEFSIIKQLVSSTNEHQPATSSFAATRTRKRWQNADESRVNYASRYFLLTRSFKSGISTRVHTG